MLVEDKKGRILERLDLPLGAFDHVFVHSVHKTPVVERFRILDGGAKGVLLHLYELNYEDAGVGMPSDVEGGFRLEKGNFILAMDREFARIPIQVSIVPGHGLVVGGRFIALLRWAREGEGIILEATMATKLRFRR